MITIHSSNRETRWIVIKKYIRMKAHI